MQIEFNSKFCKQISVTCFGNVILKWRITLYVVKYKISLKYQVYRNIKNIFLFIEMCFDMKMKFSKILLNLKITIYVYQIM